MPTQAAKRLTTRVTSHVQETLQAAADLVGATLNQFVVQAALEKAEKVIDSETSITLTRRESLRLLELLENPPERTEKFRQAQERFSIRSTSSLDSDQRQRPPALLLAVCGGCRAIKN